MSITTINRLTTAANAIDVAIGSLRFAEGQALAGRDRQLAKQIRNAAGVTEAVARELATRLETKGTP